MSKVSLTKELEFKQNDFFSIVSDYEKYPEFIAEIKKAKIISKKPKQVAFELDLVKKFNYVLEFSEKSPEEIVWKLVESNLFKKNNGGWKIKKKDGVLSVTYALDVEFGFLVPSFVVNKMVKKDLPKMIEQFSQRTESLYGA